MDTPDDQLGPTFYDIGDDVTELEAGAPVVEGASEGEVIVVNDADVIMEPATCLQQPTNMADTAEPTPEPAPTAQDEDAKYFYSREEREALGALAVAQDIDREEKRELLPGDEALARDS